MSRVLHGIGVSPGTVIGPALVIHRELPDVPDRVVAPESVDDEVRRLYAAVETVRGSLEKLRERAQERAGPEEAGILDAQILMLEDSDFLESVERLIRDNQLAAERAFEFKALEVRALWANSANSRLRERVADLSGIQLRVLHELLGEGDLEILSGSVDRPVVVFTRELAPGLTLEFGRDVVVGFASEEGTRTSHAAILARSLRIPCVMGLVGGLRGVVTGTEVILDGTHGTVTLAPAPEEIAAALAEESRRLDVVRDLERMVGRPATKDGFGVTLRGNLDLPEELEEVSRHGAEGIGLLRTEFLIVGRADLPDEAEQTAYFSRVARCFPDHPIVVRSYDVGGDKFPAAFRIGPEPNPFLGWRAIRVCLDQPAVFRTQLRAMLRARLQGDIRLMLPLVIERGEVERTRDLMLQEMSALRSTGVPTADSLPIGVMVETPAAAGIVDHLADVSDFLSIGTNDLTQYTLAVDRGNARLADRFTPFHPAVLRMIKAVRDAGEAATKPVSVCGEMASEPLGAFLLVGLGFRELSVSASALPLTRWLIRQFDRAGAARAAEEALAQPGADRAIRVLEKGLAQYVDLRLLRSGRLPGVKGDTSFH